MSAYVTPPYGTSIAAGETLIMELAQTLAAVKSSRVRTKSRYQNWRAVANNPSAGLGSIGGANMLAGILVEGLFGIPMLSGFGDVAKGVAHVGALHMLDADSEAASRRTVDPDSLDQAADIFRQALNRHSYQEQQVEQMRELAMLLVMALLRQQETQQGGDDEGLVPDPLRHPKLARFKQNRASLSCIRTMFQREADVVTPRFNAPKYMCA